MEAAFIAPGANASGARLCSTPPAGSSQSSYYHLGRSQCPGQKPAAPAPPIEPIAFLRGLSLRYASSVSRVSMSRYWLNPAARSTPSFGLFEPHEYRDVNRFFESRLDLRPTPLHRLPGLASELGLGELLVKDESDRLGLNAFKILGVSYAVDRLLRDHRAGSP